MRAGRPRIRCAGSPTAAAGSNATPARPRTSTSRAVTTCGRTALRAVVPSVVPDPACGGCAPSCALTGGIPGPVAGMERGPRDGRAYDFQDSRRQPRGRAPTTVRSYLDTVRRFRRDRLEAQPLGRAAPQPSPASWCGRRAARAQGTPRESPPPGAAVAAFCSSGGRSSPIGPRRCQPCRPGACPPGRRSGTSRPAHPCGSVVTGAPRQGHGMTPCCACGPGALAGRVKGRPCPARIWMGTRGQSAAAARAGAPSNSHCPPLAATREAPTAVPAERRARHGRCLCGCARRAVVLPRATRAGRACAGRGRGALPPARVRTCCASRWPPSCSPTLPRGPRAVRAAGLVIVPPPASLRKALRGPCARARPWPGGEACAPGAKPARSTSPCATPWGSRGARRTGGGRPLSRFATGRGPGS